MIENDRSDSATLHPREAGDGVRSMLDDVATAREQFPRQLDERDVVVNAENDIIPIGFGEATHSVPQGDAGACITARPSWRTALAKPSQSCRRWRPSHSSAEFPDYRRLSSKRQRGRSRSSRS